MDVRAVYSSKRFRKPRANALTPNSDTYLIVELSDFAPWTHDLPKYSSFNPRNEILPEAEVSRDALQFLKV